GVAASSLAGSMPFTLAAATVPSPPSHSRCHHIGLAHAGCVAAILRITTTRRRHGRGKIRARHTGLTERVSEAAADERALDTRRVGTHVGTAAGGPRARVDHDDSAPTPDQPNEPALRSSLPASQARAAGLGLHAVSAVSFGVSGGPRSSAAARDA